jgi:hypothetical protein
LLPRLRDTFAQARKAGVQARSTSSHERAASVLEFLDFWPLCRWPGTAPRTGGGARVAPESWRFLVVEKLPFFALSPGNAT